MVGSARPPWAPTTRPWPDRHNNLGIVLRDLGDLGGARIQLERALTIGQATLSPGHSLSPPFGETSTVLCSRLMVRSAEMPLVLATARGVVRVC